MNGSAQASDRSIPLPGLAQMAMQGGTYAAKAILRKVQGQPEPPPFEYFDKGSLAVIGRAAAVANVFGARISTSIKKLLQAPGDYDRDSKRSIRSNDGSIGNDRTAFSSGLRHASW